jgi:hypothetical protein
VTAALPRGGHRPSPSRRSSRERERGGRLIAETDGIGLYVTRTESSDGSTQLNFALGTGVGLGDSVEGWRERFDEHAIVVLGPTSVRGKPWDRRGRFPLLGVTARSVDRVELRYETGRRRSSPAASTAGSC